MKQFIVFTLFALCVSRGFGKNIGPRSFHPNDVISFLAENSFAESSSSDSSNCFTYYMPILNKISEDTQAANQACNQVSQEGLAAAATAADDFFKQINTESADLSSLLNSCTEQQSTSDGLSCYVTEGDENIPTLSKISNDARTAIREYNQQVQAVNGTLETCNAEVSAESEAATQEVYAYLMSCVQTGITVTIDPQVTISTAVPTTVKPATTTTVVQTTVKPATTTTVVQTTVKPATTEKATTVVQTTVNKTTGAAVVVKTTERATTEKATTE